MGDWADIAYTEMEREEAIEAEKQEEFENSSNKELVDGTKHSRKPLVVAIRKFYRIYGKLSEKQRWVLFNKREELNDEII